MERVGWVKNNPGLLGDQELINSFIVRQAYLALVLEAIADSTEQSGSNRHSLIVGPRGIGKTMLVRRIAAEVRTNVAFCSDWFPIVYGEETYQVATAGEFWLEALIHLNEVPGVSSLTGTIEELRDERDDGRLAQRALGHLMDFADSGRRRLLLIVENLNMLCEQISDDDAWKIRHSLLNEPRIMLIGTATSRFSAVTLSGQAWYNLFAIHELKPLDRGETIDVWRSVAGQDLSPEHSRAIRILTGGNPRLLMILAGFAASRSFQDLMENLVHLIDDHIEYFKSHLDALPPKERKVFVALLDHWNPVTSADVARTSRLNVNEVSASLNRLVDRGAVEVLEARPRKKIYQAAERLFNIYYLMRRRGQPSDRVRAAVSFMILFYGAKDLVTTIAQLAQEACTLPLGQTEDHFAAYAELVQKVPREILDNSLEETPDAFFFRPDTPDAIRQLLLRAKARKIRKLKQLIKAYKNAHDSMASGDWAQVAREMQTAVFLDPEEAGAWRSLGSALMREGKTELAIESFERYVSLEPSQWGGWALLARVLEAVGRPQDALDPASHAIRLLRAEIAAGKARPDSWVQLGYFEELLEHKVEAETAYREAITRDPDDKDASGKLGLLLVDSGRFEDAERVYRAAIERGSPGACLLHTYGRLLVKLGRPDEGLRFCEQAIQIDPSHTSAWTDLANALESRGRVEEAEDKLRHVMVANPTVARHKRNMGAFLDRRERHEEALTAFRSAVETDTKDSNNWSALGHSLSRFGPPAEAEAVWQEALTLHPSLGHCAVHLIEAKAALGVDGPTLIRLAGEWIERQHREPLVLDRMARLVVRYKISDGLPTAEEWSREAVSKDTDWEFAETFALVAAARGDWLIAIERFRAVLNAASSNQDAQKGSTGFLIQAAAAGFAEESVACLADSPAALALEPLLVGIRLYAGKTPQVAKEIFEIGKDVADRIRETARQSVGVTLAVARDH